MTAHSPFATPSAALPENRRRGAGMAVADRTALVATLLTPVFLMHGHAIAEATIGVANLCFLARCLLTRDWAWLRGGWIPLGLAWWGWLGVCSLPLPGLGVGEGGIGSALQAAATLRFLLFAAAMQVSILQEPPARRWMYWVLASCAAYMLVNVALQFLTGYNIYGEGHSRAGELTGPFDKPRVGPPLSRLVPPVVVPIAALLLARRRWPATIGAGALILVSACLVVVVSQRMPTILTATGLLVAAVLLPRLRPVVVIALVAGGVLVGTSAIVSPPTWKRLVVQFSSQLEHFGQSHYGFLYGRSITMAEQDPVTGRGYDGFRTGCPLPRYGERALEETRARFNGAEVCTPHPHNFYMQALTDGGFPGLMLFCGVAVAWLVALGRGLWRDPAPVRAGLFASTLVQLWPVQSTSSFFGMPMGGWFFLLLGWGLAESRAALPLLAEESRPVR
ncbi:MAG: O-antigen ligase family protein [Acetobacteraceae bacterium]|nr:O-antigen ligase family protein [Acetobacteraceae bacterium]